MKKVVLGIILILGVGIHQVEAQTVSYGVKANGNLSNFILDDMKGVSSNMGFGASLGSFVKFDVMEHFAIQPELFIHYQSSELKEAGKKRDYEYWGIEAPVYAMGQWKTGSNDRFYVGAGPYVGYGFSSKLKSPELNLYKKDKHQHWDLGIGALIGYEFSNHIQINASYKIGFLDALDEGKKHATMLPQRISLGVGYRF